MPNDRTRRSVLRKGALTTVAGGGLLLGSQSVAAEASDYTLRVEHLGTETIRYGIAIDIGDGGSTLRFVDVDSNADFRTNSEYFRILWASEMEPGDVDITEYENCEDPVMWHGDLDYIAVFQDDERIH